MNSISPIDAWQPWWSSQRRAPLGPEDSYLLGAAWLHGLATADWGCGLGWMAEYIPQHLYLGVDGTKTPAVNVVADLREYKEPVEGIFMRHVLEHNEAWGVVLRNALEAFQKRMVLVIFTPPATTTHVYHVVQELGGVVEMQFKFRDVEAVITDYKRSHKEETVWWGRMVLPERGPFKAESVWLFEKGER